MAALLDYMDYMDYDTYSDDDGTWYDDFATTADFADPPQQLPRQQQQPQQVVIGAPREDSTLMQLLFNQRRPSR